MSDLNIFGLCVWCVPVGFVGEERFEPELKDDWIHHDPGEYKLLTALEAGRKTSVTQRIIC